jgi:amino acid transporter
MVPSSYLALGPSSGITIFFSTKLGQFIGGSVGIAIAYLLLLRGTRGFLVAQKITFVTAMLGTVVFFVVLSAETASTTLRRNVTPLLQAGGISDPAKLIEAAKAAGWQGSAQRATLAGSVALLVWPVLPLIGAAFSIAIGGEIRKSTRNQIAGMTSSLCVATLLFIGMAEVAARSIGNDVQGASAFLADLQKLNLGGERMNLDPTIALLSTLTTDSVIARIVVMLGFCAWIWFWVPGLLSYGQRAGLAWALDRVVPAAFGRLHDRFGTPYLAILAAAVITEVFLALIVWTEFFATLVFILAGALAWGLALLFGAAFPYLRRAMFDRSALGVLGNRGRLLMSAACAAGTLAMTVVIILLCRDELAAGDLKKGSAIIAAFFFLGYGGFLWSARRRRQSGIDLRRTFEEIPVE